MSYGGFPLPKGFRFHPSDDELLSYYLEKKNQRVDPQITAIFPEIDVSQHEPRDLPALVLTRGGFLDREWFTVPDSPDMMEYYFFSPILYKHSSNSSKGKSKSTQIDRTTKGGSWKKQGKTRMIKGSGSNKQHIGGMRIFTFYLPGKMKTDWVIHEYYLTKAGSDEQIGDYVLCRLKDNQYRKKSGKSDHDRQDGTLCDEEQGSNEPGNVAVIHNSEDYEAEYGGICSMALNVEALASKQQENVLPFPYGNDDDPENGDGSCHVASSMLTSAEEYQDFGALKDAVLTNNDALIGFNGNDQELKGYTSGPGYDDRDPWVCNGQPDSNNSPQSEMTEKVLHKPGALAFPDTSPITPLQSPIYRKLDTNNSLNDENRKRKFPFADSDLFVKKKNHTEGVRSTPSSDSENQAANMISEGYAHPGGNLASDLPSSQELLSINREPRDLSHDNDYIEWDDLPPITDGFESFLANFSDAFTDGTFSNENSESAYALEQPSNAANHALFIGEYQSRHQ